MKKINICFVCRGAYGLFNNSCMKKEGSTYGGVEVDIYNLSRELAKDKNFEVKVIVGDFGQPKQEIRNNIKLIKGFKPSDNKIIGILKIIWILLKINPDIYFLERANGLNGIIRLISKLKNEKLIYRTASDVDCNGRYMKENKIEGFFYKYALKNSSAIIVQNYKNKKQLLNKYNLKSKVIKNAAEIPNKISGKYKEILWVGRSEKLKNPFLFLDLARSFPKQKAC